MREAAETRSYAAALSVLVVAEWLYLDWASRASEGHKARIDDGDQTEALHPG